MVEKSRVERSGVEKSGVEKFLFEDISTPDFSTPYILKVENSGVEEFGVKSSGFVMSFNLPSEMTRMEKCESQTPHESTWLPILWALKLLERARSEGKIRVRYSKNLNDTKMNLETN